MIPDTISSSIIAIIRRMRLYPAEMAPGRLGMIRTSLPSSASLTSERLPICVLVRLLHGYCLVVVESPSILSQLSSHIQDSLCR